MSESTDKPERGKILYDHKGPLSAAAEGALAAGFDLSEPQKNAPTRVRFLKKRKDKDTASEPPAAA